MLDHNAWTLARLAGVAIPRTDSPGARFLKGVRDDVVEAHEYESLITAEPTDRAAEIADNAVPVYTEDIWAAYVDLGAWQVDETELAAQGSDMTRRASVALYLIAERLAYELIDELLDELAE